nr:protein FAR1-related sequence 5-like [Tanacetum cinerariifolium]
MENSELVVMFWVDEVDKCNYKEFGDIISFDATFRTNKYDMVFDPFTRIDNHRKCVTVSSRFLLIEDTEAYTWLLRLCMWHIMQKVPAKVNISLFHDVLRVSNGKAKEIIEPVWACQILECKTKEGCEIVKVRDKRASAYRTFNKEKEKEVVQQKEYVAEYKNCDIEVIQEKYILRHWRRDIIPPTLRRNKNRYGEKNETIEKLTNKANYVVDECLFLLSKDEGMLATFVEQLKTIKQEVQVQVPKPPSQK